VRQVAEAREFALMDVATKRVVVRVGAEDLDKIVFQSRVIHRMVGTANASMARILAVHWSSY